MPTPSISTDSTELNASAARSPNSPLFLGLGRGTSSATPNSRSLAKMCRPPVTPSSTCMPEPPPSARAGRAARSIDEDSASANTSATDACHRLPACLVRERYLMGETLYTQCRAARNAAPVGGGGRLGYGAARENNRAAGHVPGRQIDPPRPSPFLAPLLAPLLATRRRH